MAATPLAGTSARKASRAASRGKRTIIDSSRNARRTLRLRGLYPIDLDLGHHQALRALGEAHHHVGARLQVLQAAAPQRLDVNEDVARLGLAHHQAVALGAVEPLDLRPFERAARDRRPPLGADGLETAATRPMAMVAALAPETVPVAVELAARPLGDRRGRGLVEIHDVRDLPALRTLDHVADDSRALERILPAHVAQ